MLGASVAFWLCATMVLGARSSLDVLFGMLGPLAAATGTSVMIDRTMRIAPDRLTALMIAGFGAKMVFFAAYISVVVAAGRVRPAPFALSFAGSYIGLHMMEAIWLRRLLSGAGRTGPRVQREPAS